MKRGIASRCRWAIAVAFSASAGCHAGLGGGGRPAPPAAFDFTVTERAETGPITALAVQPPYLWAAGAPGLRRFNLDSGDYEEVGAGGQGSRGLTALATDDRGVAWVAGELEVGRWVTVARGELRYEGTGSPGPVVVLAPQRTPRRGVWAGGARGLYYYDGRSWSAVGGLGGADVTWVGLDDDGAAAWVAARSGGLYRAEAGRAVPAPGGVEVVADRIVGMAKAAGGTRVVAGNLGGEARLYALTLAGVVGFHAPAGTQAVALVQRGANALLVAGPPGAARGYTLQALGPNELVPAGGLRFSALGDEAGPRWAGLPIAEALPAEVTTVATGGGVLYCGSAHLGIARAAAERARPLDGSELVGDADRFSVACRTHDRCLVVTEGPRAWQTDGDQYQETSVGEAADATVLAVARDPQGGVYAISAVPKWKGLVLTRRAPGRDDWQPFRRIALELPARTTPALSFASISPAGVMWMGLRVVDASGEDAGYGAIESDLQTGLTVQHRPRRQAEARAIETLPFPADLNGAFFDAARVWTAALEGVSRLEAGQLRTWSENDGLPSDLVWRVARGNDGAIWAATSDGLARFDGANWRPLGGSGLAVRGLVTDEQGRTWAATGQGLRVLERGVTDPQAAPSIVSGDLRDLTIDHLGRLWALSSSSIAVVTPKSAPLRPPAP